MTALRFVLPTLLLASTLPCRAQISSAPTEGVRALKAALAARWTGVLEYRDYSEPPTSTKRVQLPTWLTISDSGANGQIVFHYVYDDGPNKVVDETDTVALDSTGHTWSETTNGKPAQVYSIDGLERLKSGRGELVLTGKGTDNDKPADKRITLQIRRNLLVIRQEARPAGSADEFAFRHQYVFTRAEPPAITPSTR